MNATVNLFLDKRTETKANKDVDKDVNKKANKKVDKSASNGIVKLCITFNRVQRYYSTGIKPSAEDWTRLQENKNVIGGRIKDHDFIELHAKFYRNLGKPDGTDKDGFVVRALAIFEQLGQSFSFERFKHEFDMYGIEQLPDIDHTDIVLALNNKGALMRKENRISNGILYELAAKSLMRFVTSFTKIERIEFGVMNDNILRYENITPHFLTVYEQFMLQYGKQNVDKNKKKIGRAKPATSTTVGIYLRHVRAVFNDAISKGIAKHEDYPFKNKGYVIPAGTNTKKALSKEDILKIVAYECINEAEQRAKDLWLFSYLGNGMNFADMAQLRWNDLDLKNRKMEFVRQKTKRSKKGNQTKIKVDLKELSLAIIERQGVKTSPYLFGFIGVEDDATRQKAIVKQLIKQTNSYMNRIAKTLAIDMAVNTYSARHSFSTILMQSEAPLSFISKSLGHRELKTTEVYLGSFDSAIAKKYTDNLL